MSSSGLRSRLIRVLFCALAAIVGVLSGARPAAAGAPFELFGDDWEGLSEFVAMARAETGPSRIVASTVLDFGKLEKEDAVILFHPEVALDTENLAAFLRAGGRVIQLDDFGTGDALLKYFAIDRIPAPTRPIEMLRGNPEFALAEPTGNHPVLGDVVRVVTNHPTALRHSELTPILMVRGAAEPNVLVALAGAVGHGRLLCVGDPSIAINSMLRFPGNRAFMRGLVRYAVDDDSWGKRQGKIYIVTNDFVQRGAYGEKEGESWYRKALSRVQSALASVRKSGFPSWLVHTLAFGAAFGLILWVAFRAGRSYRPSRPVFLRPIPLPAHGGVAGHAAVLSGAGTSPALLMLELRAALDEALSVHTRLEPPFDRELLYRVLRDRKLLDGQGLATLDMLFKRFARAETLLLSRRDGGFAEREVTETARQVHALLERVAIATDVARDSESLSPATQEQGTAIEERRP